MLFRLIVVIILVLGPVASFAQVPLLDATLSVYEKMLSEIQISYPESCLFEFQPTSEAQLFYASEKFCNLKVKKISGLTTTKLIYYSRDGRTSGNFKTFSKKPLTLYETLSRYLPEWEASGSKAASVQFKADSWREITPESLAKELSVSYSVDVSFRTKTLTVNDKMLTESSNPSMSYALVYPFSDSNKDLYEVFRGYISSTKLVLYSRDHETYLVLSEAERSRESLARVFAELRAMFDDKLVKAQQVGNYFPKSETEHLRMLYALLSDAKIISYYPSEISPVSETSLLPLGLKKYSEIVRQRLSDDTFSSTTKLLPDLKPDSDLVLLPPPTSAAPKAVPASASDTSALPPPAASVPSTSTSPGRMVTPDAGTIQLVPAN